MPGKRALNRPPPTKKGRIAPGGKTRSSSLLPKIKPIGSQKNLCKKAHKEAQKARDQDVREELNSGEVEFRKGLLSGSIAEVEPEPLVKKREEGPKELERGGGDLALRLEELEMAMTK